MKKNNNQKEHTPISLDMESFAQMLKDALEGQLDSEYRIEILRRQKDDKTYASTIKTMEEGERLAPAIHLDKCLVHYKAGIDLQKICQDIINIYKRHKEIRSLDKEDIISDMQDFEKIKDRVCIRLVNQERNQYFPVQKPRAAFHDLATTFFVPGLKDGKIAYTVTPCDDLIRQWEEHLPEDGLFPLALANTQRLLGAQAEPLEDIVMNLTDKCPGVGEDGQEQCPDKTDCIYVVSNLQHENGAAAILYPGLLRAFADKIGHDFYILPSSIHETIFIPDDGMADRRMLLDMVRDVNRTEISEKEFLSDNIYHYCRITDQTELIR